MYIVEWPFLLLKYLNKNEMELTVYGPGIDLDLRLSIFSNENTMKNNLTI